MRKLSSESRTLEQKIYKILNAYGVINRKFLVALSGGADSVALLYLLIRVVGKNNVHAFYYHHGKGVNAVYRDRALNYCKKLSKKLQIDFSFGKSKLALKSEDEMRKARYLALREECKNKKLDFIMTAHHLEDLVETRLLRLIRGTGLKGLVGIKVHEGDLFRPLLESSKQELLNYLKDQRVKFIEDPSNKKTKYVRNWLREVFLKPLEKKQPGAINTLARSFENIVSEGELSSMLEQNQQFLGKSRADTGYQDTDFISRIYYLSLSKQKKTQLIAEYVISLQVKQFRHSQIEEVIKRLDNSQNIHNFHVGGLVWSVNAEQVRAKIA